MDTVRKKEIEYPEVGMIGALVMLHVIPVNSGTEEQSQVNLYPPSSRSHGVPAWQLDGWQKSLIEKIKTKKKGGGERKMKRIRGDVLSGAVQLRMVLHASVCRLSKSVFEVERVHLSGHWYIKIILIVGRNAYKKNINTKNRKYKEI
jgi:hypothetical protein